MKTSFSSYDAVDELVDYIVRGPRSARLPTMAQETWLESFLKVDQLYIDDGPLQARALYVVPALLTPTTYLPVVRDVSWDRAGDRIRLRERAIEWPAVSVTYYSTDRRLLEALDTDVKDLDSAVSRLPPATEGINLSSLRQEYPDAERLEDAGWRKAEPAHSRPWRRRLSRGTFFSLELAWSTDVLPEVDEPWLRVWQTLGECCVDERRLDGVVETYAHSVEQYAELLAGL